MLKENLKKTLNALPGIAKFLLAGAVVFAISLLTPNNVQLKYTFENGERWKYEDLYAPFDFAITKSQEETTADIDKVNKSFSPYYKVDLSTSGTQKQAFTAAFEKELDLVRGQGIYDDILLKTDNYRQYGLTLIDKLYEEGIIALHPDHQLKDKDFVINVLSGSVAEKKTLTAFLTKEKVSEIIGDSLFNSGLKDAEFLIPLLETAFVPNILYAPALTKRFLDAELQELSTTRGAIHEGDLIIKNGDFITQDKYQELLSFSERYHDEMNVQYTYWNVFGGYFLLIALVIAIFIFYLQHNEKQVFAKFSNLLFLLMWIFIYSYLVHLMEQIDSQNTWLLPFAVAPIVIKNFYNDRLALFTHISVVLIAGIISSLDYEFAFVQITAGVVAVLTNTETRFWSRFFNSIFLIFTTYMLAYLGLSLIRAGNIYAVDTQIVFLLGVSSGLTLLAYPLIPLMEKLFGFTSAITLAELSDLNRPLLKELSLKAPGTLQHSLQVANLAEAAARRIGANALLVKVGAHYHDIGKMKQAAFFIENQGSENPHDTLNDPFESARIITSHVTEGVRLAKKHRLPTVIIDFIRTHHGTTRAEYFYRKFVNENPDAEVDEKAFTYEGPKPRTKEETILMIADSLEAASKSLKQPTEKDIEALVHHIVDGKIKNKQLDDSALTFKELQECIDEIKKLLTSIHHIRVAYPGEKKKE